MAQLVFYLILNSKFSTTLLYSAGSSASIPFFTNTSPIRAEYNASNDQYFSPSNSPSPSKSKLIKILALCEQILDLRIILSDYHRRNIP